MIKSYNWTLYTILEGRSGYCNWIRDRYWVESWCYEYDISNKVGRFSEWEWNNLLLLTWEIAQRINALLFLQDTKSWELHNLKARRSNCHIAANYLAGIDNQLWKMDSISFQYDLFDENWNVSHWLKEYQSLNDAIIENQFPILCTIYWEHSHALIILWVASNGRLLWFEQRWYKWEMMFCDVRQEVYEYAGGNLWMGKRKIFCKSIPSFSSEIKQVA